MSPSWKPIEIVAIDTETVEGDSSFQGAYAIYVKLSAQPDSVWGQQLLKWQSALSAMKRDVQVAGDRLRLVFTYGDDVSQFVQFVRFLVKWVNDNVEEQRKKEKELRKTYRIGGEIDQDEADEIRKKLKGL